MDKKSRKQYSKDKIQKLKSNVRIEDIVGQDFDLKKFGKNFFTSCPFCNGNQSLSISSEKQFGHCFSCNESFDVFGYFQKVKGLNFSKAVIEVKKFINLNNDIELRKLLKASIYFSNLKQGKNPISNQPMISKTFTIGSVIEAFTKIDWILAFLISDYSRLDQEKKLLPEELTECKNEVNKVLAYGLGDEDIQDQDRLKNLFNYILEILKLIEDNNCNLSGLVYGLK